MTDSAPDTHGLQDQPDPPALAAAGPKGCEGACEVAGADTYCELEPGHQHEHEATHTIDVYNFDGTVNAEVPFLVWWGDDGHAFVGSARAVDTGRIG